MILRPPYSLSFSATATGAAITSALTLEALGARNAVLTLRSLAPDTLVLTIRDNGAPTYIPPDGVWMRLTDALGATLFRGLAKRRFSFPENLYSYTVSGVYQGLIQTTLTAASGNAFVSYPAADLVMTVWNILDRATTRGLPLAQHPNLVPNGTIAPKTCFRSASIAQALEDVLKWSPDTVSHMDYSVNPPRICFRNRNGYAYGTPQPATTLALDTPGHGVCSVALEPFPEARALCVSFCHAQRVGSSGVDYLTQTAGNPDADAARTVNLYLSGADRSEMLVSEALVSATNAMTTAKVALDVANAAAAASNAILDPALVAAIAALPNVPDVFDVLAYFKAHVPAVTAQASLPWASAPRTISLRHHCNWTSPGENTFYAAAAGATPSQSGWAVPAGTFTANQIATAGAVKTSGVFNGTLYFRAPGAVWGNATADLRGFTQLAYGWPNYNYATQAAADAAYELWGCYSTASVQFDFLSKAPSTIRAALETAIRASASTIPYGVDPSTMIDRAAFLVAPPGLAAAYFASQDWTPYKGTLTFSPGADFPGPGQFVNITGTGVPAEWNTMKAPVSELSVDLATGAATVTLGPSARMDFSSLQDRLRIPPEDNYEPG